MKERRKKVGIKGGERVGRGRKRKEGERREERRWGGERRKGEVGEGRGSGGVAESEEKEKC
jgi:hypothetical protein